jgi:inward rectifier potassium channel
MAQKDHNSEQVGKSHSGYWRLLNRDGSFNIVRSGRHVLHVTDLYHSLLAVSWKQFFGLVLIAYLFVNIVFASMYALCGHEALQGASTNSALSWFLDAFFFSVQTLATIGYGRITPTGVLANSIVTFEALCGLMGFAVVTGLVYGRFSRPTAKVIFSGVAAIAMHDGVPSLVFRMANERMNQIVEAKVSVVLSKIETTSEGEVYRTFYDLDLERSQTPIFALTWTVVHPITPKSPLHGATFESLIHAEAEIIVTVTGIDETLLQSIHSRFSYMPHEIVWDRKFVDIITRDARGRRRVHIERINDVEAITT